MRAFLTRLLHFARRRRYLAIWSAGLLVIALVIAAAFSPFSPLDRLNDLVFDTYQKLRPRAAAESAVAVVDIDDESIRQLGQWPWSRTVLASVIDRLTAEGAAAIGLDMILSEPDRTSPALAVAQLESQGFQVTYPGSATELDHDRILAASFAKAPVVAGLVLAEGVTTPPPPAKGGFAFAGDNPAAYLPSFPGAVRNLVRPRRGRARPRRLQLSARGGRRRAPDPARLAPWRKLLSRAVDRVASAGAGRVGLHRQEHGRQQRVRHRALRHDGAQGRRARGPDRAGRPHLGLLFARAGLAGGAGAPPARRARSRSSPARSRGASC